MEIGLNKQTKDIIVFGSTGSIGAQTLDCVKNLGCKVTAMSAGKNIGLFEKQIREFLPSCVAVFDTNAARILRDNIKDLKIPVFSGTDGIAGLVDECGCDIAVNGIVGIAGIKPTLACVEKGITVATANKESLVVAGGIITARAKASGASIIPVDSEHSAIFQALGGITPHEDDIKNASGSKIKRLILTASGGAFRGLDEAETYSMTKKDALRHPNWSMGEKITVDCATMMNKGFEIIEAVRLFCVEQERIDVVIHPESVIHSMLEFCDSSVLAQLSLPDMHIAIQYALSYPDRFPSSVKQLDFTKLGSLTFCEPDSRSLRAINLCRDALKAGGTAPAILNAANEKATADFLCGKITFGVILDYIEETLNKHIIEASPSLEELLAISDSIIDNG